LADFFYVWLKRTQGHRRPEWFASYLCDKDREAVKNLTRHRPPGIGRPRRGQRSPQESAVKEAAQETYQRLMTEVFGECHRVLRDDGALTVMFTHKKQEAWEALFQSLIATGFTITATWPVQTESQHSLHQAEKNAAQSTVILVARKRAPGAQRAYFDDSMKAEIREVARRTAERLQREGLNPVDQLVGAFGPAMEVFSRYPEVRTDRGGTVGVGEAIQAAADAVAEWRVEQLAKRGIEGIDAESRFVLLCWDVLQAAQFRFNEAMLLGRSVRMDVSRMKEAGLLVGTGDKVRLLPARERRRERPVHTEQEQMVLFEGYGRTKRPSRKVHPNDEYFASAIDMCHALALRCLEARGEQAGIGAARGMALQQGWKADSACARLMEALVRAAPEGVRFPGKGKKKTAADEFPEFRAWHAMLKPLFGIEPPEWKEQVEPQAELGLQEPEEEDEPEGE
jgi:adenine-specific DNA methylase